MSAIRQANSKSLMLFSGRAYPELATEIGGHLGEAVAVGDHDLTGLVAPTAQGVEGAAPGPAAPATVRLGGVRGRRTPGAASR